MINKMISWMTESQWALGLFWGFAFVLLMVFLYSYARTLTQNGAIITYKRYFNSAASILFITEEVLNKRANDFDEEVARVCAFISRQCHSIDASARESTKKEEQEGFDKFATAVEVIPQIAIFFTAVGAVLSGDGAGKPIDLANALFKNLAMGIGFYIFYFSALACVGFVWRQLLYVKISTWRVEFTCDLIHYHLELVRQDSKYKDRALNVDAMEAQILKMSKRIWKNNSKYGVPDFRDIGISIRQAMD